ncbi:phage holin family protein [Novosphingobium sp. Leaf2]|uniref:phage holin family protein n=1 Tax=Novosphingobium sp. Leaf2 TaxID=1735670 RepID=UPI001F46155B|nr:phage holin family protein [Novosphingobium sp. Leaf2]
MSLMQDLRQLADEAKSLAQAEIAYQKSRASFVGSEARTIVVLMVLAAVMVFFAGIALVVGSVIALVPLLGPWAATACVTLVLLLLAVLGGLSVRARIRRIMTIMTG